MIDSFWNNRPVFITGANGFTGAHLVKQLFDYGAKIICLQRHKTKLSLLDYFGLREKVKIIDGSIEDISLLKKILSKYKIDAVFHLAAQPIAGTANNSPLPTFETNIRGTYLLLEACRQNRTVTRIVAASSDRAYGSQSEIPYHEDFPLRGLFPYDVSKACADLIAQSFARSYQLPVTISRPSNIYGGGDLNLSRIIPGTIVSVLKNENPIIRSDGTPVRQFIHIKDVVRGYLLLAEQIDKTGGEAFNFSSDEPVQMIDLVNKIIALMDKKDQLSPEILLPFNPQIKTDVQHISAGKMFNQLGWKTEINLKQGLRETIDWYRRQLHQIN